MSGPSLSRQIAAVEATIAIALDGKLKPVSREQQKTLRDDATAAVAFLRRASQLPDGFLERARFFVVEKTK